MNDNLKIGFIQTNIDNDIAWGPKGENSLQMKVEAELYTWQEIKKGFHNLFNMNSRPNIIVMPELAIPLGYVYSLKKYAELLNAVVFAGIDYIECPDGNIQNKAIMIVPEKWDTEFISKKSCCFYMGKYCAANAESKHIETYNSLNSTYYKFHSDPNIYIIDAGKYGKIGFAICADFYDLERYVAYRGRVQHIIILAYNKDTNSFFALAEAISRLIMCNVVICNTGHFGDSLVFSPYKKDFMRMIFRHQGSDQFMTQIVNLPVNCLFEAQSNIDKDNEFKVPPQYKLIK